MNAEEAIEYEDVTHMTKVALKALLNKGDRLLCSDLEYKKVKGNDYELYI